MPALENEKITEWAELIAFYEHHYRPCVDWSFQPKDKIFLGDRTSGICRFCGKTQPEVTFRKEAHALPQAIGNKTLLTYYECDSCNLGFGQGCENDFGNWSLPMRTMARICGNNGIPTVKLGPEGAWRIERHADGLSLSLTETEGFYEDDPARNALKIHLRRSPYRPVMVVKALFKMALSIMPEEEMPNFQNTLHLIRPEMPIAPLKGPVPFFYTFIGGPIASDRITVVILIRKSDDFVLPYCFFVLMYGNEMLQIAVPSFEKDSQNFGKTMDIKRFPSFRVSPRSFAFLA
jgi:HNH endonuclease